MMIFLKLLSIQVLSRIYPSMAAYIFSKLWFVVPRPSSSSPKLSALRSAWIEGSEVHQIQHRNRLYKVYQKSPLKIVKANVVLIHGWAGKWEQFLKMSDFLVDSGFQVTVFDLPAHGENGEKESDMFEFSEFFSRVINQLNLQGAITICHSAGFLAVAYAIKAHGHTPQKIITIGSPAQFHFLFEILTERYNISTKIYPHLWRIIQARVGVEDPEKAMNTNHLDRYPSENVFVIHDENDSEVLIKETDGMRSIWPGVKILQTTGLGHNKILRDDTVIRSVVEFCNRN